MNRSIITTVLASLSLAVSASVSPPSGEGVPRPASYISDSDEDSGVRPGLKSPAKSTAGVFRAATPEGKVIRGYQSSPAYGFPVGLYRIQEWGDMEFMHIDDYSRKGYALTTGWIRDGRLCALAEYFIFSIIDYRYLEMDPFTGEILEDREINLSDPVTQFPNYLPYFYSSAYDPDTDTLYGYTSSESGQGYAFYSCPGDDPSKATDVKTPPFEEICMSMAFNTDDGNLYGINRNNDFVKISTSGEQTVLMPTNFRTRYTAAGLTYVPERKKFIWVMMLTDYTHGLVEIDPDSKSLTLLGTFDDVETFPFIFMTDSADDPDPIKAPEVDGMNIDHADGSVTVSYFLPTEYFAGGNVSGPLQWYATLDGEESQDGAASAGDIIDVEYNGLEPGEHTFGLYVRQGDKGSSVCTRTEFVGYDIPLAPENVTLTESRIEWKPVTRCKSSGYLDPDKLIYHVYVNDQEVGTTAGSGFDYNLPENERYTNYTAKVVADNAGLMSDPGISESIRFGKPWELDVTILPTAADAAVCSAFDLNNDRDVWSYSEHEEYGAYFSAPLSGSSSSDDWLFLPPMNFDDPDVSYQITYEVWNSSKWYPDQRLAISLHPELDPRVIETVIQEKTTFGINSTFETYTQRFAVSRPGTYYVALYTDNDPYNKGLRVRNIQIRKLHTSTEIPSEVTGLSARGASLGELKAIVDFDLPSNYLSGARIPEAETIKATVKCADNAIEVSGKPGTHMTVEIGSAQGTNRVYVLTSTGESAGKEAYIDVFTGVDVPMNVTSLEGRMSEDNLTMTLRWDKPSDIGENGYYVNPDDVEYFILTQGEAGWEVFEELGKNVFEYTYSVEPESPLTTVRLGVVPGTVEGRSNNIYHMSDAMGKPYDVPLLEEFENATFKYGPIRIIRLNEEYVDAEWGVVNPRLIDPAMEIPSEVAAYGRSEGPSKRGMLMLPKFNLEDVTDPEIVFNIWTGESAADITIYGETFDHQEFIEIGKVPSGTQGWQTIRFPFPDSMKGHKWVAVYIDAFFDKPSQYAMFSSYEVCGDVNSVKDVAVDGGWIRTGNGEIEVCGLSGKECAVYSLSGQLIWVSVPDCDEVVIPVQPGIYIVRAGQSSIKVAVSK